MDIDSKLLSKIKREYLSTDTSYRKLAEKYGVHYKKLANIGLKEAWASQKSQVREKTVTKTVNAVSDQMADRAKKFYDVADKLQARIKVLAEQAELADLPPKDIRALTASLKDLREIYGFKSDADRAEQEARIAKLRKEADADAEPPVVTVVMAADLEDLSG